MFETFGVPGLYIAVQAVLALAASWSAKGVRACEPSPFCLLVTRFDVFRAPAQWFDGSNTFLFDVTVL